MRAITSNLWIYFAPVLLGGLTLVLIVVARRNHLADDKPIGKLHRIIAAAAMSETIAMNVYLTHFFDFHVFLLLPTFLSALPLLATDTRNFVIVCGISAFLVGVYSFVTAFSVGKVYPPAGALLIIAGIAALTSKRAVTA